MRNECVCVCVRARVCGGWQGGPFPSSTGVSNAQIEASVRERYTAARVSSLLTEDEAHSLTTALEMYEECKARGDYAQGDPVSEQCSSTSEPVSEQRSSTSEPVSEQSNTSELVSEQRSSTSEPVSEQRSSTSEPVSEPVSEEEEVPRLRPVLSQGSHYGDKDAQTLLAVKLLRTDITRVEVSVPLSHI
jgi:hypothetical protein